MGIGSRIQHAWNVFKNADTLTTTPNIDFGYSSYYNEASHRMLPGTEKSIVSAIINRIAIDVASIRIQHVRLDENGRYLEELNSGLDKCLTLEANLDQTSRAFIQDLVTTMCDEGVAAIVPVDMDDEPTKEGAFRIKEMRIGTVKQWYPEYVEVEVYSQQTGKRERVRLPKKFVGIVENPLYSVMNEPNSTLKRLIRKLNILDAIDEQSGAGKLDLIIQLPYLVKTETRKEQAEKRRKDIEQQLAGSKYGIAYTDGTEKVTQLNRPVENNLLNQIKYLTDMLYSQLGITEDVMKGIADEQAMLNYNNRTIEPIIDAIALEIKRKFLTKTARSQGQSIMYFRDPFKLVPVANIADIADKFTRNEVLSSNEVRALIGYKPVKDARADELRNKNLNQESGAAPQVPVSTDENAQRQEVVDKQIEDELNTILKES